MATLVSIATGNFGTAGTWGTADASSYIDSEAGTINISTSNIDSPTFTPGAITIDRALIKISSKLTTGTFTLTLRNSTDGVDVVSVTVNVSDLPSLGWACIYLGSQTLIAAKNYIFRVVCSNSGNQVVLHRSTSGTNNMSKMLVTTTTAAPGSGDQLLIPGELTGAGTGNDHTVTMNNTATTSFGPTVSGGPPQGIYVTSRGILTFGVAAATNYYLRWKGLFASAGGGVINIGTSGARIPVDSTVTLEYDCAAAGDSKLVPLRGGIINVYGAEKTCWTKLTANAAGAATSFTCADTTGWRATDIVAFSPTGTNINHHEKLTVDTVPGATSFTTTGGLANSKLGGSRLYSFLLNLTRNVRFSNVSSSNRGNIYVPATGGDMHMEYANVTIGHAATNGRTVDCQSTTNTAYFKGLAIDGLFSGNAINCYSARGSSVNNFTFDNCIVYHYQGTHFYVENTSGTNWAITNCVGMSNWDAVPMFDLLDAGGTVTGNKALVLISGTWGFSITESASWIKTGFDDNEVWYSQAGGMRFAASNNGETISLSGSGGVIGHPNMNSCVGGMVPDRVRSLELTDWGFYGVGNCNLGGLRLGSPSFRVVLNDCEFDSTPARTSHTGISIGGINSMVRMELNSCEFGQTDAHTTGDLAFTDTTGAAAHAQIFADNCLWSTTPIANLTQDAQRQVGDHVDGFGSFLRSQKHNQTAGSHRTYLPNGVISLDSAFYNTASPSERLTPNNTTYKFRSSPVIKGVDNGVAPTISVYVRKSASGDGAAYNGAQPRLILLRSDALGVTSNQVLATMSVSTGTWEELSATAPTPTDDGAFIVYVDCDGTAGWIDVDDWS